MKRIIIPLLMILSVAFTAADGIDSYTKLMFHADGDDAFSIGDGYGSFDGSNDYISVPTDSSMNFGSGPMTISFMMKSDYTGTSPWMVMIHKYTGSWGYIIGLYDGFVSHIPYWGGMGFTGDITVADGRWHHVVVTREGTNAKLYIDGQLDRSDTVTQGNTDNAINLQIGNNYEGGSANLDFDGELDDVAFYNRALDSTEVSALYDNYAVGLSNNITSGLVAYYPMDANFDDMSSNSNDGTANGDAAVTKEGHIYTANGNPILSSVGKFDGAMKFDGEGDYLSVSGATDFQLGTDDFTVDLWVKTTDMSLDSGYNRRLFMIDGPTGNANNNLQIIIEQNGGYAFLYSNSGSLGIIGTTDITDGQWHHVAATRESGTVTLYVDGQDEGSQGWTENVDFASPQPRIGAYTSGTGRYNGLIDELRISNGIARWTSSFTPDTTPYEPDANTVLLEHFDGDVSDSGHNITWNGDADVSASTYKFDGSYHFDGTGDYLSIPDSDDWYFGTDDFTIDMWVNFNSVTGGIPFVVQRIGASDNVEFYYGWPGADDFVFLINDAVIVTADWSPNTGQWYHLAVVRSGNNWYLFIDGQVVGTATNSIAVPNKAVQLDIAHLSTHYFNGYMDEIRISKGIARWTSSFTPDTTPYDTGLSCPDDCSGHGTCNGLTGVCACETDWAGDACDTWNGTCPSGIVDYWTFDDADISGSIVEDKIGSNNATLSGALSGRSGQVGEAVELDGSNDMIIIPEIVLNGDFSVVALFNSSNIASSDGDSRQTVLFGHSGNNDWSRIQTGYAKLKWGGSTTTPTLSPGFSTNVWEHFVMTRSGSTVKIYKNGAVVASDAKSQTYKISRLGHKYTGGGTPNWYDGLLDDVAIFNRTLTPPEISEIYDRSAAGIGICGDLFDNMPTYTEFNGTETTDFSNAEDVTNVTNVTLGVENKGKIHYPESHSINAENADLDSAITIDDRVIVVNSSALDSTFNSTATLTFENVDCSSPYVYYSATASDRLSILAENNLCTSPRCTNIQCSSNTLTVDVTGFSGYAAEGNANLTIDADDPKDTDVEVHFTAEYLNVTSGSLITGANCTIYFTDDTQTMSEGASQYTYNRTFSSSGNKEYNVTCSATGYNTLTADDTATITSSGAEVPEFSIVTLGLGLIAVLAGIFLLRRK